MQMTSDAVALFRREFELCRVNKGELVAILSEPKTRPEYVEATAAAVRSLGADVFEVCVPGTGWQTPTPIRGMGAGTPHLSEPSRLADAVVGSLKAADLIVDLIPETIIHVPIRQILQQEGCRILTVVEAADTLERMFPPEGIKESVLALAARIEMAGALRLTSAAGTDLNYELPRDVLCQYGYADEPGRWDHWPGALVSTYPVDGKTNGVVVLAPGDVLFPFKRYVEDETRLRIENGYVVEIEGGLDAFLVRDFLEAWEEPEVFAVSHVGWGMLPRAQWSSLAFHDPHESIGMDARSALGGFIFSTGPNRFTGRYVEAHVDIVLHDCETFLDGERVAAEDFSEVRSAV